MNDKIKHQIIRGKALGKFLVKGKPESERKEIDQWLSEDPNNQKVLEEILAASNLSSRMEEMDEYDAVTAWKLLVQKALISKKEKTIRMWKLAAAVLLIVGLGGIIAQFYILHDVKPETELLNTKVVTQRGQTSKVILPDSTVVYLNSATELVYTNHFMAENRNVQVNGEAYFEVSKDAQNPFTVSMDNVMVQVHGTEFNVRTDERDQTIDVILDEGKVELMHEEAAFKNTMLNPGQRAQINGLHTQFTIDEVDSYKYTSWRDGILIFQDDPMSEVFKKLESWYDVDIEIQDQEIYDLNFNATIMDESLEEIFDLMSYTCNIDYKIQYSRERNISSKVIVNLN